MLLAIDVGNTKHSLTSFNEDKSEQILASKTDPRDTADELWLQYAALVARFDITRGSDLFNCASQYLRGVES